MEMGSSFFQSSDMISVYGGTGFIGGAFCDLYPDEVIKISRESRKPESKDILYLISTTSNYNILEDLHLDINTNLNVLMETLQHCKDNDITINFISTGFVYGLDVIDSKETDLPDPRGLYSITKRSAEEILVCFCENFGCKYRIIRLSNVYGTDKTISMKKNVLGFMVNKLKNNEDVCLYEGGMVYRDYMHVDDVCRAIKFLMEHGEENEIYNVGTGHPMYYYDIISMVKDAIPGCTSEITSMETPEFYSKNQPKNFYLNCEKLIQLGFKQNISLQTGIEKLCTN
jgi:nucleoside-diphosphate-sugar epimerase